MVACQTARQKSPGRNLLWTILVSSMLHGAFFVVAPNGRLLTHVGWDQAVWQLTVHLSGAQNPLKPAVLLPQLATQLVSIHRPPATPLADTQTLQADKPESEITSPQPDTQRLSLALVPLQEIVPVYPVSARNNKIYAYVVLDILLTKEGGVRNLNVVETFPSGASEYEQAVLEAFAMARFAVQGNPDYVYRVRVDFSPVPDVPTPHVPSPPAGELLK